MQILLLAIAFGFACAQELDPSEINGDWHTVAIAASNPEKIDENGDLRTYFRSVQCFPKCAGIFVRFYVISSGVCKEFEVVGVKRHEDNVFVAEYSGTNFFQILSRKENEMTFFNINVDEQGKETRVLLVAERQNLKVLFCKDTAHQHQLLEQGVLSICMVLSTDTSAGHGLTHLPFPGIRAVFQEDNSGMLVMKVKESFLIVFCISQ
ncbi:PREDICTED: female-specific lacrimal gland protein-like [Chinchilla lanigera]|uniref:female-specific lacrimal gland protein-like n=1 Tax=Chinchilla lanigera TaxID=34839 RepID=UPI00038E9BC0|nr:PREDICTED: female-specific lacrimal gland protein-like [Chinchilla lanigera]